MLIIRTNLQVTTRNWSSSSEEVNVGVDVNFIQPYAFEPIETDSDGKDSGSEEIVSEEIVSESSSNSGNTRLQDTNW